MACILGIDHPLVAVRDMNAAIETYTSLGFYIAPPGQHPWGTATALALFHHQLLEIVSIGDPSLLDGFEAGGFKFGRHVEYYLTKSEGVALSALYSDDAEADAVALSERGIDCTGTVNFGRDVVRSDGKPDRTKTTLKIFYNNDMPRLSVFACQQHRRDLLEFPERMKHPNGAHGFEAATIVCDDRYKKNVRNWFCKIHGSDFMSDKQGHHIIPTTNGFWRLVSKSEFERLYHTPLDDMFLLEGPRIAALDVRVSDLDQVLESASDASYDLMETKDRLIANDMSSLGGIVMSFVASS